MFVRHRWPQSFRWWLFCRFPREDAAADYECAHDCPENPKWHLLHCGVLRCLTPLLTHYTSARASSLAPHQLWQLGNVRRDPPYPTLIYLAPAARDQISLTHHLTDAVPILHTRAPVSVSPLSPGKSRDVGAFYLRKSSGSLAMFAAIPTAHPAN